MISLNQIYRQQNKKKKHKKNTKVDRTNEIKWGNEAPPPSGDNENIRNRRGPMHYQNMQSDVQSEQPHEQPNLQPRFRPKDPNKEKAKRKAKLQNLELQSDLERRNAEDHLNNIQNREIGSQKVEIQQRQYEVKKSQVLNEATQMRKQIRSPENNQFGQNQQMQNRLLQPNNARMPNPNNNAQMQNLNHNN